MSDLFPGAIVALECLGDFHNPEHKFLDAVTQEGRIKLSPGIDPPFTGARWQVMEAAPGTGGILLVSAGAVFGKRYLDGRTQDGFVQAVGDSLPPFSGTRWRPHDVSPGVVVFESLGDFHNPAHKFLDGRTHDGSVGLAPSTDPPFSGTKWRVIPLPRPALEVRTERAQIRSLLTIRGRDFTPNDAIMIVAEGIVGREDHAPFPVGHAQAGSDGTFEAFAEVGFFPTHPGDVQVVVRAVDRHGRTAHGFSRGFSPL